VHYLTWYISQLGKKYDNRGVCYDLDSEGHIVGTVLHMNKVPKSKRQVATNYNIVWEFTAFGESDLAGFLLIDGVKEGQRLISARKPNQAV
jgi:hypothetical protein